ncbi:MAG: ATP-binding protein [Deltaproteobacteria bacterium]|nr:ATP-binding protein [Deltaproteobacteria bacterium]MBW1942647.1 ATP-binding protein [Deltaproteobacteria bacterium]MBW2206769.1 ATP-binding protein [Deltaproteobacteria bacterium]
MHELSLHIMDIAENGISAGATLIEITVTEDNRQNRLKIVLRDNGRGMSGEMMKKVMDPFFTTRTTRRVGLGLSLFKEASKRCEGEFHLHSEEGKGTEVMATFRLDHIDLAPMGNIAGALTTLIMGNPEVEFLYTHEVGDEDLIIDTREIKNELDGLTINDPHVIKYLADMIREGLADLRQGKEEEPHG